MEGINNVDASLIPFLRNLADSIEEGRILPRQLQRVGEFFMAYQFQEQAIKDGDKIKFVYVKKPNPFQEDVIAFPQELPKEFGIHSYVDYDLQFEKVFLDALQTVIEPLGWKTEEQSSLEDFFG